MEKQFPEKLRGVPVGQDSGLDEGLPYLEVNFIDSLRGLRKHGADAAKALDILIRLGGFVAPRLANAIPHERDKRAKADMIIAAVFIGNRNVVRRVEDATGDLDRGVSAIAGWGSGRLKTGETPNIHSLSRTIMDSDDALERTTAVLDLGLIGTDETVSTLIEATRDEKEGGGLVRGTAAWLLGKFKAIRPDARGRLEEMAGNDSDREVKEIARYALGARHPLL